MCRTYLGLYLLKNSKEKKKEISQLQWEILTEIADIKKLFV